MSLHWWSKSSEILPSAGQNWEVKYFAALSTATAGDNTQILTDFCISDEHLKNPYGTVFTANQTLLMLCKLFWAVSFALTTQSLTQIRIQTLSKEKLILIRCRLMTLSYKVIMFWFLSLADSFFLIKIPQFKFCLMAIWHICSYCQCK